jgi:HD-GYP domain-containing protein (c-di-GMP phosphodiesterase class II)
MAQSHSHIQSRTDIPRRRSDRYLRLGVLLTMVEALALRDDRTARHGAAVARYARVLAHEVGCTQREQRLVHSAGLLHDIGKFALPDRALRAGPLSGDDWAIVRRLPQESAALVGRLEGYGAVAEIILYHHEHVDGSGYPAGLIGKEIPLLSRILAVANVYDTLTSRDSYRPPLPAGDAREELGRSAGVQLDAELVARFGELLERDAVDLFGRDEDFDIELDVERATLEDAPPEAAKPTVRFKRKR